MIILIGWKSVTRGYASLDYELAGYRASSLVKVDILLNGEPVDAPVSYSTPWKAVSGRQLVENCAVLFTRQMFEIPVQAAAIGNKVIARENVRAMRKAYWLPSYGDISRKRKLLENKKKVRNVKQSTWSANYCRKKLYGDLKMD